MELIIKLLDGTLITINANPSSTIGQIKAEITKRENIPFESQRLIFQNVEMNKNNESISAYKVSDCSIINLNILVLGGAIRFRSRYSLNKEYLDTLGNLYKLHKKICRKCYAVLPEKSFNCRNRKCGHNADIRNKKTCKYERSNYTDPGLKIMFQKKLKLYKKHTLKEKEVFPIIQMMGSSAYL